MNFKWTLIACQPIQQGIVCLPSAALADLSQEEAQILFDEIKALYPEWVLEPGRSYLERKVRFPGKLNVKTTALSKVVDREMSRYLPQGSDGPGVRRMMTEIQMMLHAHPLNERRRAEGRATVDSVWVESSFQPFWKFW